MMKDNQDMIMENMANYSDTTEKAPWKILIVDDEVEVHRMTRLVLGDVEFNGRALSFLSAQSAREARDLLGKHSDIAIVLLDVVMETDNAGLELVTYIRNVLKNDRIRIIIRSGQTGSVSEQDIVSRYGIDDYKSKLELTNEKLNVSIISSLRAFQKSQEMFNRIVELEEQIKLRKEGLGEKTSERELDDGKFKNNMDRIRGLVRKADEEKESIIVMSSEILTPLYGILEMAERLLNFDLDTEQKEQVQTIHGNCKSLQATIKANCFKVVLKKKLEKTTHSTSLLSEIRKNNILVAMDNDLSRKALVGQIEALDCRVVEVENGHQGLEIIAKALMDGKPFQVVLVGLDSPVMDSVAFAQTVKTNIPDNRPFIIAIKTTSQNFSSSSLEKKEFDAYVSTPVCAETVASVLDSLAGIDNGGCFGKKSKVFSITKKNGQNTNSPENNILIVEDDKEQSEESIKEILK